MNKQQEIEKLKNALAEKVKSENDSQYMNLSSDEVMKIIIESSNKGKYSLWICREYLKGNIQKFEDIESRCKQALILFKNNLNKFTEQQKQLNKMSFKELENLVSPYQDVLTQKAVKRMQKEKIWSEIETVYEGPEGRIYIPKTEQAAIFLGKGTRWCTAAASNNMFNRYNNRGSLYVFVLSKKDEEGREIKYQLHFETNQFMDVLDRSASTKHCEFLFEKLYDIFSAEEKIKLLIKSDLFFKMFSLKEFDVIYSEILIEKLKIKDPFQIGTDFIPDMKKISPETVLLFVKNNALEFNFVPEKFRTKEFWEIVVFKNIHCLGRIPVEFLNSELIEKVIENNPNAIKYVPKQFMTKKICETAVKKNGHVIDFIPLSMVTEEFCLSAVTNSPLFIRNLPKKIFSKLFFQKILENNGLALEYIPFSAIDGDEEKIDLCKIALKNNAQSLKYVSRRFMTQEVLDIAFSQNVDCFEFIPTEFQNRDICLKFVKINPLNLKFVAAEHKTKELCELAVQQNGSALCYVPKELRTKKLCETAVKQNGLALKHVPNELMTQELCELAAKQNGLALEFFPVKFKTKKTCDIALEENILALKYVPQIFMTYELCKKAAEKECSVISCIPKHLMTEEFYKIIVSKNGKFYNFIPKESRTSEIAKIAVTNDYLTLKHIEKEFITYNILEISFLTFLKKNDLNYSFEEGIKMLFDLCTNPVNKISLEYSYKKCFSDFYFKNAVYEIFQNFKEKISDKEITSQYS